MATRTIKTAPAARKKAKSAVRLTQNDKQVMKRSQLLRRTTRKRKKENDHEPTDKPNG